MIPIGLKPGLVVGSLFGFATAIASLAGELITICSAVAILAGMAVSAIGVGRKFQRLIDMQEESKKDRESIHAALQDAERKTVEFRQRMETRMADIEKHISDLPCDSKYRDCSRPEESTD